jgi:hypothetical protein
MASFAGGGAGSDAALLAEKGFASFDHAYGSWTIRVVLGSDAALLAEKGFAASSASLTGSLGLSADCLMTTVLM